MLLASAATTWQTGACTSTVASPLEPGSHHPQLCYVGRQPLAFSPSRLCDSLSDRALWCSCAGRHSDSWHQGCVCHLCCSGRPHAAETATTTAGAARHLANTRADGIIGTDRFAGQVDVLMVRDCGRTWGAQRSTTNALAALRRAAPPTGHVSARRDALSLHRRLLLPIFCWHMPMRALLPQLAMLCSLVGSSFWVNMASRLGLAVSTSHAIGARARAVASLRP